MRSNATEIGSKNGGVEIGTLDNPGWQVKINLEGTPWADRQQEREIRERTDHDWYHAWSDGHTWEAFCGPQNLGEVLGRFRLFLGGPVEDVREAQESEPVDPLYRIRFEPPGFLVRQPSYQRDSRRQRRSRPNVCSFMRPGSVTGSQSL